MQNQRIDIAKIEQLRRRRIKRKRRLLMLVVLIVALALAYFTGIYGASLSVLGDLVDTISISINKGSGFPQDHSVTGLKTVEELAGGVALLGDNDLLMYSPTGKQLQNIQHGYGHPAISVSDTRLLLYNRSGKELRVESRTRNLFKNNFDQPIMLAQMGRGGSFAVVTRSTRNEAELTVYNSLFDPVFWWYSAEDSPIALAVSDNGKNIGVGAIRAEGGALSGVVYLLDTNKDTEVANVYFDGTMPLKMQFMPDGNLLVVFDTFAVILNGKDGTELARYNFYDKQLQAVSINGKTTALLFGSDTQESSTQIVVLDGELKEIGTMQPGTLAANITLTRTNVFAVLPQSVQTYNLDGTYVGETSISGKTFSLITAKENLVITQNTIQAFETPLLEKKE